MSNVKLRPYLTLEEIKYISDTLSDKIDPTAVAIRRNFAQIIMKYDAGFIKGSYIPSPRESTLQKLGAHSEELNYLSGNMTPEQEADYERKLLEGD